jgi:hypothetical protein
MLPQQITVLSIAHCQTYLQSLDDHLDIDLHHDASNAHGDPLDEEDANDNMDVDDGEDFDHQQIVNYLTKHPNDIDAIPKVCTFSLRNMKAKDHAGTKLKVIYLLLRI